MWTILGYIRLDLGLMGSAMVLKENYLNLLLKENIRLTHFALLLNNIEIGGF